MSTGFSETRTAPAPAGTSRHAAQGAQGPATHQRQTAEAKGSSQSNEDMQLAQKNGLRSRKQWWKCTKPPFPKGTRSCKRVLCKPCLLEQVGRFVEMVERYCSNLLWVSLGRATVYCHISFCFHPTAYLMEKLCLET